jgi:hypothetical protein
VFSNKQAQPPVVDPMLELLLTLARNDGPIGVGLIVDGIPMAGVLGPADGFAELLDGDLVRLLDAMNATAEQRDGVEGSFTRIGVPRMHDDPFHIVLSSAKVQTAGEWDDVAHVMIDLRKVSAWWPLSAQGDATVTYEKG